MKETAKQRSGERSNNPPADAGPAEAKKGQKEGEPGKAISILQLKGSLTVNYPTLAGRWKGRPTSHHTRRGGTIA